MKHLGSIPILILYAFVAYVFVTPYLVGFRLLPENYMTTHPVYIACAILFAIISTIRA
jgi:succinate dehydrogenase/fumarate reductase cytochrome b subunit